MKTEKSFNVQIWVGLKERYSQHIHTIDEVRAICDEFVNEVKDCVTITPTEFRYVNGNEPGVIIGYIKYPRFPRTEEEILSRAMKLADNLMLVLGQFKVTITTPDSSFMLENELLQD